MGLKEGTLKSLVEKENDLTEPTANSVFSQILQAIDYLAYNDIVHRDVKPENILYISAPSGQYHFQIGDFGTCNRDIAAATYAGIPIFMDPEIVQGGNQTPKVDVWSLFVTMLWCANTGGFRQNAFRFNNPKDRQEEVIRIASNDHIFSKVQEMAILDPVQRASAAQIIVKIFSGERLTTPRNHVPALPNRPLFAAATTETPTAPSPILATRFPQPRRRLLSWRVSISPAPNRVEKVRGAAQIPNTRRLRDIRLMQNGE